MYRLNAVPLFAVSLLFSFSLVGVTPDVMLWNLVQFNTGGSPFALRAVRPCLPSSTVFSGSNNWKHLVCS